jgi:hypothetical protein
MKIISTLLFFLFITSCTSGKEKTYTGSTPAANVIRSFLGISLSDSVDFIRWELFISDDQYHLRCNYGIGKPNTNGFINGGKRIELRGELKKEKFYCHLQNGNKILKIAELNEDLLHLLDADNNLLVGNGGWSYTLNNVNPLNTDQINFAAQQTVLKDSMAFEGRTPCKVPGVIVAGTECYKLKWYIVLYANAEKNEPGTYKLLGTLWYKEGGRKGNWRVISGKNGRIIYQLNDEKGNIFVRLLKIDEHILVFTGADGKLLAGDEDFSYTLNRKL